MPLLSKNKYNRDNVDNTAPASGQFNSTGGPGPFQQGPGQTGPMTGNPNAGTMYHRQTGGTAGTGTKLAGKVEFAIGSLVGSQSLKAKGLAKEREADAATIQRLQLAEAERLEREAILHRQNVAGQGAHPMNAAFGQGNMPKGAQGSGKAGGFPQ